MYKITSRQKDNADKLGVTIKPSTNKNKKIDVFKNGIKIASIPTMLQFVFAYMYSGVHEDEITHLMCVAQRLVDLANHKEKRRYALLTPVDCLGTQETLVDMKKHKAELYAKLSTNKSSVDFLKFFFTYNPNTTKTKKQKLKDDLKKTRKARYESSY